MEKKRKIDPEKILDKIEQEEKYQKEQNKSLDYKTFLKDSQRKKIRDLIKKSEERVNKLNEKLSEVDKKTLYQIKHERSFR